MTFALNRLRRASAEARYKRGVVTPAIPSPPQRALLLINRTSRSGGERIAPVLERLRGGGLELEIPDEGVDWCQLIDACRGKVDCVIVGGGDGSLNAVAPALIASQLPLGILPFGTANDLARTLKIPGDPLAAADIILDAHEHPVDVGVVNGRHFFNVANIGFGAATADNLSPRMKKALGPLSYLASVLLALRSSLNPFHADIVCDGRRQRVQSIQIAVGNGRYYGGGMAIAHEARIDDQLFFLYSVQPLRLWDMFKLIPALRTGRFRDHDPVLVDRGSRVEIVTRKPKRVSADGEQVTETPALFELRPCAVRIRVPASYMTSFAARPGSGPDPQER